MVWVSTWTWASAQSTSSPSIQIFSVGVMGTVQSLSAMASPTAAVEGWLAADGGPSRYWSSM